MASLGVLGSAGGAPQSGAAERYLFLDTARSVAIALAIFSHAQFTFSALDDLPAPAYYLSRLATRSATPTFMLVFGCMLEIVYLRRLAREGPRRTTRRLIQRGGQCWLGYVAIGLPLLLFASAAPKEFAKSCLFLDNIRFANALKFYTFALLLAAPIVVARWRLGLRFCLAMIPLIWVVDYLVLRRLDLSTLPDSLQYLTCVLVGHPADHGSIYIFQAYSVICLGMIVGRMILTTPVEGFPGRLALRLAPVGAALAAVVVAQLVAAEARVQPGSLLGGVRAALDALISGFRDANEPAYYAWGALQALTLCVLASVATPPGGAAPSRRSPLLVFGRKSLATFVVGNAVLNIPWAWSGGPWGVSLGRYSLVLPIAYVLLLWVAMLGYERGFRKKPAGAPVVKPT